MHTVYSIEYIQQKRKTYKLNNTSTGSLIISEFIVPSTVTIRISKQKIMTISANLFLFEKQPDSSYLSNII